MLLAFCSPDRQAEKEKDAFGAEVTFSLPATSYGVSVFVYRLSIRMHPTAHGWVISTVAERGKGCKDGMDPRRVGWVEPTKSPRGSSDLKPLN